jgi:hypothetical protein
MSTPPIASSRPMPMRRLLVIAALLPAAWSGLGGAAWATTSIGQATLASSLAPPSVLRPVQPAGLCTPTHLSGCDGTDSPFPGDGRTLRYCGPDGVCTRVPGPQGDERSYYAGIPTRAPHAQHAPNRH